MFQKYDITDNPYKEHVLIWDGECGFCQYWMLVLKKKLQSKIKFIPYQEAEVLCHEIPKKEFMKASGLIEKEIEIGKEQARQEGKPENIIEKIALGKLNKFFQENTLLSQSFVKDSKQTVQQYVDSVNKGMTVSAFKRVAIG